MTQIVTSETAVATDVSTNESATAVSDQKMVKSRIPNTMRQELGNILAMFIHPESGPTDSGNWMRQASKKPTRENTT